MMRQIRLNKKVGLFVLLFIVTLSIACFSVSNIFAEDVKNSDKSEENNKKKACSSEDELLTKYNPDVKIKDGKYVLSLNPAKSESEGNLKKVSFLVSKVAPVTGSGYGDWIDISNQGLNVSGYSPLVIDQTASYISEVVNKGKGGIAFTLITGEDPTCKEVILTIDITSYKPVIQTEDVDIDSTLKDTIKKLEEKSYASTEINCSSPANASEKLICYAKEHNSANKTNGKISHTASFTCDSNRFYYDTTKYKTKITKSDGTIIDEDANSPYEHLDGITFPNDNRNSTTHSTYYVNKKYLYDSEEHIIDKYYYTYHFNADNNVSKKEPVSCKVKCEEGVVVEYGPPVASKAGLCFQYKIKVTSNVRCYMSVAPTPPKTYNLCTPAPVCVTKSGVGYRQGGPNDEYDSCVKNCDGGKYSKKCSKKCYNKIYGNTTSTSKTATSLNSYSTTKLADNDFSLATCQALNGGGCYLRTNGTITWESDKKPIKDGRGNPYERNGKYVYLEGRWYDTSGWHTTYGSNKNNSYPFWNPLYGVFRADGFYRHDRGNNSEAYCHDNCHWEGCSSDGDYYLNPGFADKDYKNNMETYAKLLQDCQAATSCSESTATFAIKVNYSTDEADKEGKWIYFPYSTKNDKTSKDEISSVGLKENKKNTAQNKNSTILSYDGCYEDNNENGKFYQAEWSFPGSWINNKTGEISYVDKSGSKGWRTMPNKFCVPLDARNVNTKWWNYYYSTVLAGSKSSFSEYKNQCFGETGDKAEKYNIVGETTKFGKFNWDVTVSCFYALNGGNKSDSKVCTNTSKSRVRSVDLENLFPAKDGSKSDQNSVGRKPGFNWSTYANTKNTITASGGNSAMVSEPNLYLTDVQNLGYSIYGNDYLDYEFDLSPSDLKQLRSVTKDSNHNYTSYSGTSTVSNKTGVTRYTMANNVSKYATKKANDSARECNNMINYQSGQCYVYGSNTN